MSHSVSSPDAQCAKIAELATIFRPISPADELAELSQYVKSYPSAIPLPPSPFPNGSLFRRNETLRPSPYGGISPTYEFLPHIFPTPSSIDRDVYGSGSFLSSFESHIARLFGKSSAMFNLTGVQCQMVAARIHSSNRNPIIACHPQSHVVLNELNGHSLVFGLSFCLVGREDHPLTFDEVKKGIVSHWKVPSMILIELPEREVGGGCISWEDLIRVRALCDEFGIMMHLDGARIWEVQPFFDRAFEEIGALFDSVYVSFYKGLGAMTGAMLIGGSDFISSARQWQRRLGGNPYSYYPFVISCERGFNLWINSFGDRWNKMKSLVEDITIRERLLNPKSPPSSSPSAFPSDRLLWFWPPIPTCAHIHVYFACPKDSLMKLRDEVVKEEGIEVFKMIRKARDIEISGDDGELKDGGKKTKSLSCSYHEWKIGPYNLDIPNDVFLRGYEALINKILKFLKEGG